ncbi:MAG: DHH family phosphoesterase [Flavobacteriales bacterium]|nr:DHH family phosphoesterase [Flavobacteriales bacterium]
MIFCLDYNATNRLGPEMKEILEAAPCKKIMIDHHLNPEEFPTLMISETTASSTS